MYILDVFLNFAAIFHYSLLETPNYAPLITEPTTNASCS